MTALQVFLVVIFSNPGGGHLRSEYPMPSWEICNQSVSSSQQSYSSGDESEGGVIIFCASKPK